MSRCGLDPKLISRPHACLALNELYQENYYTTRDKLLTQPKGKQFDFNESAIFGKFDLFCRRVEKLQDMFTTVEQFANLAGHRVEGMESLMKTFQTIVDDFRRKPNELLDYQKGQFDRDYLEFNANIHELESSLQGFINSSFENITSTEQGSSKQQRTATTLPRPTPSLAPPLTPPSLPDPGTALMMLKSSRSSSSATR